jgi:hypothetical protein
MRRKFLTYSALIYPLLTDKDSNLERQNQNLQCYHYTIGQFWEGKSMKKFNKKELCPGRLFHFLPASR